MTRPVAVLRPEPGNGATAERAAVLGLATIRLPLFEVHAVDWIAPAAEAHDALLLTSANTLRHAGPALAALRRLPVFAVGAQTAAAARQAGYVVVATGTTDAAALLPIARDQGVARLLHLGGRDRAIGAVDPITATIAVYASEAREIATADLAALSGSVALLHSTRAACRLGELVDAAGIGRGSITLAALSTVVAAAAGFGWLGVGIADEPSDAALLALAQALIDPTSGGGDKAA